LGHLKKSWEEGDETLHLAIRQQIELLTKPHTDHLHQQIDNLKHQVASLKSQLRNALEHRQGPVNERQDAVEPAKVQSWLETMPEVNIDLPPQALEPMPSEFSQHNISFSEFSADSLLASDHPVLSSWEQILITVPMTSIYKKVDELLKQYWNPMVEDVRIALRQASTHENLQLTGPQRKLMEANETYITLRNWFIHPEMKPRAIRVQVNGHFFESDYKLYFDLRTIFGMNIFSPLQEAVIGALKASAWSPDIPGTRPKVTKKFHGLLTVDTIVHHLRCYCNWTYGYIVEQVEPFVNHATQSDGHRKKPGQKPNKRRKISYDAPAVSDTDMKDISIDASSSVYATSEEPSTIADGLSIPPGQDWDGSDGSDGTASPVQRHGEYSD
jgi:hypothetical protein